MAQTMFCILLLVCCVLQYSCAHVGSNTASMGQFSKEPQVTKRDVVTGLQIYSQDDLEPSWVDWGDAPRDFGSRSLIPVVGESLLEFDSESGLGIIHIQRDSDVLDSACLENIEFYVRASVAGVSIVIRLGNGNVPIDSITVPPDYFVSSNGIQDDTWSLVSVPVDAIIVNQTFNRISFQGDGTGGVRYYLDDIKFTTEPRVPIAPFTPPPTTLAPVVAPVAPTQTLAQFVDCLSISATDYKLEVNLEQEVDQPTLMELEGVFENHFRVPAECLDISAQPGRPFIFTVSVNTRDSTSFGDELCDRLFFNETLTNDATAVIRNNFIVDKCDGVPRIPGADIVVILIIGVGIGVLFIALLILIGAFVQVIRWRNKSEALVVTKNPAYEIYKMYQDDASGNKRATMSQFAEFDVPDEDSYHEITYRDNASPLAPQTPNMGKFDTMDRNQRIEMNRQLPAAPVTDRPLPAFDEY
mmetsp:Transcript_15984/g.17745  ORF Transcript_15984/g.17745 Transcript_15984/m.17745 type:complete len:470 (-) Transcript_15984:81-1490(-)|eukprot:CAMPEP_0168529578 /NCGR_PEP_ID=MMETSP0405-20121227/14012_1 /TAXON_ID=498012 /ORGANISM="Trichosphaerium sp, Strain Am-I-7 wt" /LENGTH=469 /DNA_ID=CAMNT_0008553369 /DNA_START=94 /DNA_END=1503 /DNA_ORIENTATION=-